VPRLGSAFSSGFTFLAIDAFGVLLGSSLVALALWKLEKLIVRAIW
jgi:hypothetical protein